MGLLQQFQSGYSFEREITQITAATGVVSGSLNLGYSYILLTLDSTAPARVRLYTDSASAALDLNRAIGSTTIGDTVGLTIDAIITSDELSLGIDPAMIGTTHFGSNAYYLISSSGTSVNLHTYPIEKVLSYRSSVLITGSSIISGTDGATGNVTVPKSFLILSASATTQSRLRLYSKPIEEIETSEINRTFGSVPEQGAHLISDMMFDSASVSYKLVPVLPGFTLASYTEGRNSVGYIFQNQTNVASVSATASLHLYSLED